MTTFTESDIKKAIIKSQHCQRNWDLTKTIPEEHLEILKTSITQSPSLQNVAFYKVHFIQDRNTIEAVHDCTHGAPYRVTEKGKLVDPNPKEDDHLYEMGDTTQTQVLANLVVVFEEYYKPEDYFKEKRIEDSPKEFDKTVAVGIASGYLNLTANLLGYETGCCISIDHNKLKDTLNMEGKPLLVMGVGYKDPTRNRRIHQTDSEIKYPTNPRQEILVVEYQ
jgi:nitroreductase